MQMNSQVAISGEGVLKNDEYDPYAVIVLNQLWCLTNSLLNNPKKIRKMKRKNKKQKSKWEWMQN